MTMSFSAKQKSLAILPKISGTLSFLGSIYIFQDVARSKRRRSKPYNRLILALSTFDIMASVANIMSTWPIPEGTPGVYGAVGTTGTCTAQGFFAETGNITTPMYNCMLCLYYLLIIRNGWSESHIRRIEPYLHVAPLVVGWTMGIVGLPLTLYNPSGWLCWYAPYPGNCLNDADIPCERGELAFVFRWVHYGIIWSAIFCVTVGMFLIYRKVYINEAKTKRFRKHVHPDEKGTPRHARRFSLINRQENALREQEEAAGRSRKVANQAMLFVGALYLTWLFTTLTRIFQIVQGKSHYPLLVLMAIFFPLQGFFNAMIYLRPRYLKHKEADQKRSFFAICWSVLKTKDNLETRDNTQYSVSEREHKRQSFVSRISSAIRKSSVGKVSEDDFPNENERDVRGTNRSAVCAIHHDDDDESINSEDDLRRIEEAISQRGDDLQRSSVTFTTSTKNFDGKTSPEK